MPGIVGRRIRQPGHLPDREVAAVFHLETQ